MPTWSDCLGPQVHACGFDFGPDWLSSWRAVAAPTISYLRRKDAPHDGRVLCLLYVHGRLVERCWLAPQLSQPTSQPPGLQTQPPPSVTCSTHSVGSGSPQGIPGAAAASLQGVQGTQQADSRIQVVQDSYNFVVTALECVTSLYELRVASGREPKYNMMDVSPALFGLALAVQVPYVAMMVAHDKQLAW